MRNRKSDRKNQFIEVTKQLQKIKDEIFKPTGCTSTAVVVDESDLSLRKLEELHAELHALQKEKVNFLLHPIQLFQIPTSLSKWNNNLFDWLLQSFCGRVNA